MRRHPRALRFSDRVLDAFARADLPEGLRISNVAGGPAEILLYDEIGYFGITAQDFLGMLKEAGEGPLRVRINSPGGDVFDGMAIYNALRERGNVDVMIDGLAASAASFIAMAGDKVTIAENAMVMVHNAWGFVIGNKADMRSAADLLDKIDGQIVGIYAAKTGKSPDDIAAIMTAETWYTGQEAKDAGFVDAVAPNKGKTDGSTENRGAPRVVAATRPGIRMEAADWKVGAARDLPIDDSDTWDGAAAAARMLDAAGFNGDSPDPDTARRGFLAYDAANPKLKGSYKLPFADVVGGTLKAVKGGIDAAASRLPQTDVPEDVRGEARAVIDAYEARMNESASASASDADMRRRRLRLAEAV